MDTRGRFASEKRVSEPRRAGRNSPHRRWAAPASVRFATGIVTLRHAHSGGYDDHAGMSFQARCPQCVFVSRQLGQRMPCLLHVSLRPRADTEPAATISIVDYDEPY